MGLCNTDPVLVFGAFELDPGSYQLRRDGMAVGVEPQVLDVIAYLARHRDRLVRKEELLDEVWGDRFVSESALTSRIKSARQVLGDDGRTQSMIRTVHGRGYQFVPDVTDTEAPPPTASAAVGSDRSDGGGPTEDATRSDSDIGAARTAFARARWRVARTAFATVGADHLGTGDLERWADAAWWDSEIVECIAVRHEAFRRYVHDGDDQAAARVAIALSDDYLHRGSSTVALTWLERASDLLASTPDCRESGQLLRLQSECRLGIQHEPEEALAINQSLRRLAEEVDDPDLIAQSMQDHGRILLALGEVDEGMALIDRSMLVAATSATSPNVLGRLYCNMLSACVGLGHYKRAQEWSDEAITWCAGHAESPFPGVCEVHRAGLRRRLGELERSLADLETLASNSQFSNITGNALLEIGEIHLLRGDLAEAEVAILDAHAHGADATTGLALIAVEQGRPGDAVELLRDRLAARSHDHVARRQLLPHLVDAAAMADDVETARRAADELSGMTVHASEACRACAARAVGTVALMEHRDQDACESMRDAVELYATVTLPFEMATARLGLAAAAHALGTNQTARIERDAALAIFSGAGAVPSGTARLWLERLSDLA
jgi:DNA-binding winged helix-turn-helix (wHTH) protein/tetratricopeptide (TPR) repeat protein